MDQSKLCLSYTSCPGKVVQPIAHNDRHTQPVMEFNRMVREDPRVENVIVPLRDGLNLIRIK